MNKNINYQNRKEKLKFVYKECCKISNKVQSNKINVEIKILNEKAKHLFYSIIDEFEINIFNSASKGNNECSQFKNGQNSNNEHNVSVSTVIHNSNSILFTVLEEGNPYEYEFQFIYDGPNSIKLNFINMEFYFTRSSTETNLSCN